MSLDDSFHYLNILHYKLATSVPDSHYLDLFKYYMITCNCEDDEIIRSNLIEKRRRLPRRYAPLNDKKYNTPSY